MNINEIKERIKYLVNILNQYNTLEIQIYWDNNSLPVTTINSNPNLAGKIYDLSISTDKSYNKKM